jgi:hypothetical protein
LELSPYQVPVPEPRLSNNAELTKTLNTSGKMALLFEIIPHCFYQQTARYPKPVKVYRESKTNPVTPTLTLLKWLIECHKNVDPFASYPVEKAQNVPFTESGKVKLTFL